MTAAPSVVDAGAARLRAVPPPALQLGPVVVGLPVVQAALSGYSDLPMRLLARAHGAGYAVNEVVLDQHVLQKGRLQRRILQVPEADHPVGGQLMGSQPETFGAASKALVAAGYDVVDLNFGCPVGKVLGRCRGGFLLREPETALAMVDAVLQAVAGDAPVTVKLRRGHDDSPAAERAFFTILLGAFERGIAAATVHPRTVVQKYLGPSRWSFLRKVKREVGDRTLLGSGDLFGAFDAIDMLQQTGVDGVTMARGCIGNPFVFAQAAELLAGRVPLLPSLAERRDALLQHWQLAVSFHGGEAAALASVRMHAIKYAQFHPEPIWARECMVAVKRPEQLPAAIATVFDPARDGERRPLRRDDVVIPADNGLAAALEPAP